jgi:hypothetical protein
VVDPRKPENGDETRRDDVDTAAGMETAKRIMKRLAETPYEPHKPLGKRPSNEASPPPKPKEPSNGRVHKGKARR